MRESLSKLCDRMIEYSFYSIFFLVPLALMSDTSELFELNKMWITWGFTIVIAASWIIKSIAKGNFRIQRTPLDIPIAIFLFSQIISTLFSLDMHVSIWGYYSRFNGGLLSIFSYILLYYAFASNFITHEKRELESEKREKRFSEVRENIRDFSETDSARIVKRLIYISLISGLVVALWGLPSHFGYDPTCLMFRGTLDVSCWTQNFQPKIRIFSTLGQPDWLAAYLSILLPITIAFFLQKTQKKCQISNVKYQMSKKTIGNWILDIGNYWIFFPTFLLTILFYTDLLYTRSRSNFIALWISLLFLIGGLVFIQKINFKNFSSLISQLSSKLLVLLVLLGITFFIGSSISQVDKFTFNGIKEQFNKPKQIIKTVPNTTVVQKEEGGTHSGTIRLIVWEGAIKAWKDYPLFGTGVETFAFAYYRYRPVAHNMTSEWDYLYNKAHNEYLNYLTTTGILGLGSYLTMIGTFLWLALTKLTKPREKHEKDTIRDFSKTHDTKINQNSFLTAALISSYIGILISNFFGFSVVIVNLYLFLIPVFVFALNKSLNYEKAFIFPKAETKEGQNLSPAKSIGIFLIFIFSFYLIFNLFKFWFADKEYALGYNLDRIGDYQKAYLSLTSAVDKRGDEPLFKDELSLNSAVLASSFALAKDATSAAKFAQESLVLSNAIIEKDPNNIVFWKTRVRVLYALSQLNPQYLTLALDAIKHTRDLAPTDAKISYNLGILYGQTGDTKKAIEVLEQTTKLKPDYRDAYYALGLFYHELSVDKSGKVINPDYQQKAINSMKYILDNISSDDAKAKNSLTSWGEI